MKHSKKVRRLLRRQEDYDKLDERDKQERTKPGSIKKTR